MKNFFLLLYYNYSSNYLFLGKILFGVVCLLCLTKFFMLVEFECSRNLQKSKKKKLKRIFCEIEFWNFFNSLLCLKGEFFFGNSVRNASGFAIFYSKVFLTGLALLIIIFEWWFWTLRQRLLSPLCFNYFLEVEVAH